MFDIVLSIVILLYLAGLLIISFGFRQSKRPAPKTATYLVTIVVSLHDEAVNIKDLIKCLKDLDYPEEKLEILLINDRSTDQTAEILEQYTADLKSCRVLTVDHLHENFAPKKYALDLAIRQAKGEIILLTDADGRPGKNWVQAMTSEFKENIGMVIGHAPYAAFRNEGSFIYQLLRMEYFSHAAVAAATAGLGFPVTCVGTNLAYRKSVYLQIDGFGPFRRIHTGDDDLLLQRIRDASDWKIAYNLDPNSFVPNAPPANWRQFHHQRLRYASKGFIYPAGFTLVLITLYFFNLILFLSPLAVIAGFLSTGMVAIGFIIKILADLIFLRSASRAFHFRLPNTYIPIGSLLHIPYVLYFGLMAHIRRFEWGGIKYRPGV